MNHNDWESLSQSLSKTHLLCATTCCNLRPEPVSCQGTQLSHVEHIVLLSPDNVSFLKIFEIK